MEYFYKILKQYQDKSYASFQSKLTPGIPSDSFIGVRVPNVRKIAKEYFNDSHVEDFLNSLPHKYYDENMLHGLFLSHIKDFNKCIDRTEKFLPYIDNWAVCDIFSPKCFKKEKNKLLPYIEKWLKSDKTYTIRFAIEMLMTHFLDEDFDEKYLVMVSKVKSDEYYVNMMIAWFFATALTKQYVTAIKFIERKVLSVWTHNKTIQKAIESYRISESQKNYLRSFKIK